VIGLYYTLEPGGNGPLRRCMVLPTNPFHGLAVLATMFQSWEWGAFEFVTGE